MMGDRSILLSWRIIETSSKRTISKRMEKDYDTIEGRKRGHNGLAELDC